MAWHRVEIWTEGITRDQAKDLFDLLASEAHYRAGLGNFDVHVNGEMNAAAPDWAVEVS